VIPLSSLLERYRNLTPTDSLKKIAVLEVITNCFGIDLKKEDISIQNNIIYLKTSPKLKGEVFINKKKILESLGKILTNNTPKDIR